MTVRHIPAQKKPLLYADTLALNGTYGDDFASATLASKWTLRQFVSGDISLVKTNTYDDSVLNFVSDQAGDAVYQAGPAGDFELWLTCHGVSSNGGMPALISVNSSGDGIGFSPYNDGNGYLWNMSAWNYSSTNASTNPPPWKYGTADIPYVIRLKNASGAFSGHMSSDGGKTWASTGTSSPGHTRTNIGFARIFGGNGGTLTWQVGRFNVI